MKRILTIPAILACVSSFAKTPAVKIESENVGQITIESTQSSGWSIDASIKKTEKDREILSISLRRAEPAVPPQISVKFTTPLIDMSHAWYSTGYDHNPLRPEWSFKPESQIARDMPLIAYFNDSNVNRLTIACNDSFRHIKFASGVREEGCLYSFRMNLFTDPEAPVDAYSVQLMLDRRPVFWSKTIEQASAWMMESASLKPCNVPQAATEPLYSSWYQFHQQVSASEIEKECKLASELGMKTIILDDGWQTDDGNRGYAFCGDWKVSPNKFPDMKAHVDAVHKMGMKYMVWYSVPFVGIKSEAYKIFEGKYLGLNKGLNAAILDPRFPEVREYLVNTYVTAMKDWGLDGFKLDFIDSFKINGTDPAIAEDYKGRDIKSVPEAVDSLMRGITRRLTALNPEVLIEFRQRYIGPAIRQYGNMLRVADCPADYHANRIHSADLRLTSGQTAVHSDMLEWNSNETPEMAARQILNSLFATVQYSLMLRDISEEHRVLIAHWIRFTQEHKETLLRGEFLPYYPQMCYPVLEARSASEQICALYQEGMRVHLGSTPAPRSYLVNATGSSDVVAFFEKAPKSIKTFDTFGKQVNFKSGKISKGQTAVIRVPVSGYAEIDW